MDPGDKVLIDAARAEALSAASPSPTPPDLYHSADVRVFGRCRPLIPEDLAQAPDGDQGEGEEQDQDAGQGDRSAEMDRLRAMTSAGDPSLPAVCVTAVGSRMIAHEPASKLRGGRKIQNREFELDCAFGGDATNEEVYGIVAKPLVALAAGGGTATVFAYGQTGTGKTHTMGAVMEAAAGELFAGKREGDEVLASIVEIMGSQVTDLMNGGTPVRLVDDVFGELNLKGAEERRMDSAQELLDVVHAALAHRITRATMRNAASSRSHACIKVRIHPTDPKLLGAGVEDGVLFVVDLAGSESALDRSQHDGVRMAEARLINTSLMTLKECIRSRGKTGGGGASDRHLHIPYRRSQLTLLLRDAFELAVRRPIKVAVVACVSPLATDVKQTINTLRYAAELRSAPRNAVTARDPDNPVLWTRDESLAWLSRVSKGDIVGTDVLPLESDSGRVMAQLPEAEFVARAMLSGKISDVRAHKVYSAIWRRVADARTRQRKAVMKARARAGGQGMGPGDEWAEELLARIAAEEDGEEEKRGERREPYVRIVTGGKGGICGEEDE
eukprot:evm.model.scf_1127.3 EVM.evm.TU.scf_1127.3   scf_1127:25910-30730(-)